MKEKARQNLLNFFLYVIVFALGITLGLGLGLWITDHDVKLFTVYEWSQK